MPASAPDLSTNNPGKLFGIVYITLTGVIDTIILAASLWSWLPSCGGHCPQKTRPELPLKTTGQTSKTRSLTGWDESVTNKLSDLPANISYNTQGVLDESPLDVSFDMD
ncbi:hypothetical protein DSO57_1009005 [Entomophthora muscae]|uniref:Uncharacterized protein n=1 Tax=Entomophthora muscae TaxID=34485 RepID=A0ACC2UGB4_9FUNG|nr:hypothetical protein DSO57_1009005 [Entomophthora muscae]